MGTDGGRDDRRDGTTTSYGLRPPLPRHPDPDAAAPAGPAAPEEAAPAAEPGPPTAAEPAASGQGPAAPHPAPPSEAATDVPAPGGAGAPSAGSGRLVGGRYRLLERLGFGGMGTVWRAHDEVVDRDVAIKEPRVPEQLGAAQRETAYLRMQREARAAARIDHPSVVTVHDVVVEDGRPWIVMELVRGRSLAEMLEEGTLPPGEAARIGLAVLGALTAAHEAGVLHRDVKPANILLGRQDRVVLTDFGIAQVEGEDKLTETGAFIGSPEYIAPERVLGQRPGPESDLWSLGVVLYQAVEGVSPFRRQTTPATFQAILLADLPRPGRAGPLAGLITDVLRKEPAARIPAARAADALRAVAHPPRPRSQGRGQAAAQDATHLLTDDVRLANGGPAPAPPAGGPAPRGLRALARRRSARWAAAAVAVAAVAAVVLAVADPFGGPGLPAGWTSHEEKALDATVAVPGDYVRSIADHKVTYTDPRKVFTISLTKKAGEKRGVAGVANDNLTWLKNGGEVQYSDTVQDADGRVTEATQQGQGAARLDVHYTDLTARDPEDKPAMRELELDVIDGKGDLYTLDVLMPAARPQADQGERMFGEVKAHLGIHTL